MNSRETSREPSWEDIERDMFRAGRVGGVWIGKDARFAGMSIEAELIYMSIVPQLPENRLIPDSAEWIADNALSFVYDMHALIPRAIEEWVAAGVVVRRTGNTIYFVEPQELEAGQ